MPQIPQNLKAMYNLMRNSGNPQQLLNSMAQQNPQMKQVMEIVRQNNGNFEQTFRSMAAQRGVDPDAFLQALQS